MPRQIGKYEILKLLAKGGMAEVFLGRASAPAGFSKMAAIKRILPHLSEDQSFVGMFVNEARITAQLSHSNIAQIFDFGQAGSSYFIAIEYIHGVDLRVIGSHFRATGQVAPPSMVAHVMAQVMSALAYAHARRDSNGAPLRIIHRDVSPSNILLSFEGEVKLIDFGIAKAARRDEDTAVGTLKGKCSYMSPEQVCGKPLDGRTDIFSAGIVIYELLTGEHPFRTTDELLTLDRIRKANPVCPTAIVPTVPAELEAICLRALARGADERYADAGDMERDLELFRQKNPLTRQDLATWLRRTFPKRFKETLFPAGPQELQARMGRSGSNPAVYGQEASGATTDRQPRGLLGATQAPDIAAIQNIPTAPRLGLEETPSQPLDSRHGDGPSTSSLSAGEKRRRKPRRAGGDGRFGLFLVALSGLSVIGAVGYLIHLSIARGPNWLPLPEREVEVHPLGDSGVRPARARAAGEVVLEVELRDHRVVCQAIVDGVARPPQRAPCSFAVPRGAAVALKLLRQDFLPLPLRYTAEADRVLKVRVDHKSKRLVWSR